MVLNSYVQNPRRIYLGQHDHYGPYLYLKIMTLDKREITNDAIAGSLKDLECLSTLIGSYLETCKVGDEFIINEKYASQSKYGLKLIIMEDTFDPASADPKLK